MWPPPAPGLTVVGTDVRLRPGWDGRVRRALGVSSPQGTVLSLTPGLAEVLGEVAPDEPLDSVGRRIAAVVESLTAQLWAAAFRWCEQPAEFGDAGDPGVWVPPADERVPAWLKPFNGDVLVVLEDDRYIAGVGVKKHDQFGHELSVGTEPEAQGRGLARRLVAQAAREVLAQGAVPTYLHAFENVASAKVAEAAGFPDRGWRAYGLSEAG